MELNWRGWVKEHMRARDKKIISKNGQFWEFWWFSKQTGEFLIFSVWWHNSRTFFSGKVKLKKCIFWLKIRSKIDFLVENCRNKYQNGLFSNYSLIRKARDLFWLCVACSSSVCGFSISTRVACQVNWTVYLKFEYQYRVLTNWMQWNLF